MDIASDVIPLRSCGKDGERPTKRLSIMLSCNCGLLRKVKRKAESQRRKLFHRVPNYGLKYGLTTFIVSIV